MADPTIVLTDAPTLPRRQQDERCPACRAPKNERVSGCGFGVSTIEVCGRCGYEFPKVTL